MQKVIVRVPGAGSLVVKGYDASAILIHILSHLVTLEGATVKQARRGAPKKVKPEASVVSEGAAG